MKVALGLAVLLFPVIAGADPTIVLHASEVVRGSLCTTSGPANLPCADFDISAGINHEYYVYVVATQPDSGLYGMSFGIDYNGREHEGVDVFEFSGCQTGLPFYYQNPFGFEFPASGASVRLTWNPCPDSSLGSLNVVVAGFLDVYAYSADVLAVTANTNVSGGPEFLLVDCKQHNFQVDSNSRAAIRFSESGEVLGYNPCTGEGTPPPAPGGNPPPLPPTDLPDQNAALYLHIAGNSEPRCGAAPVGIGEVVTSASAPVDPTTYLVYVLGSPKIAAGYIHGLLAARFGIKYDTPGLNISSWHTCSLLNWPDDEWPASGSGGTFVVSEECTDSLMTVLGYFWVDVNGPGTLQIVGYPHDDHVIAIATCPNSVDTYETLPQGRAGWVSIGGAVIGADADGCNPMVEDCGPAPVRSRALTWGSLKSKFIR